MQKLKTDGIYLDSAATARIDPEVLDAMMPWLGDNYGNPSSQYSYGREARLAIETSQNRPASQFGADTGCLTFTGGGREKNDSRLYFSNRGNMRKFINVSNNSVVPICFHTIFEQIISCH